MSIIKTEHLTHIYSQGTPYERAALQDFNIEIEEGEFAGIIGHTGSGKSTFIQHLNGLLPPTEGKVYIDGEDLWADKKDLRRFRFKVGLVFQYPEYQLFEETVYKDIAFGPKNAKLSTEEVDARVREAARFSGVDEALFERSPLELSGGQKKRVFLARAIAQQGQVILLDELGGLDEVTALEQGLFGGVDFVATLHAATPEEATMRPQVKYLMERGAVRVLVWLTGRQAPGCIGEVRFL